MLGVEGVSRDQLQIGGLDVKDAFLMANQEEPVQITTKAGKFKVMKNLPGQRLAAKAWYEFLAAFLEKRGVEFSKENPCLGKRNGSLFILLHVDDMMFCGLKDEVEKLINELKTAFTFLSMWPSFPGDKFEFLKRTYELCEDGINVLPGRYAETMIESLRRSTARSKPSKFHVETRLKRSPMVCFYLLTKQLSTGHWWAAASTCPGAHGAGLCHQAVGRWNEQPSRGHLQVMRRLIGYLKQTLGNYSHLRIPDYGKGIHHSYDSKWILSHSQTLTGQETGQPEGALAVVFMLSMAWFFSTAAEDNVLSASLALKQSFMDLSVERQMEWHSGYVWNS